MIYSLLLSVSLFYLITKSAWFFRKSCSTLCCFPQNKPLEDNFSKFTACWMLSYKCWQPSKANIMTAKNYQHQWISSDPPSTITKSRQHLKTQLRHRQPSIHQYNKKWHNFANVTSSETTSLCSASSTRLSTWHCLHLLLSAVLWRRCCWAPGALLIDISCPHSAQLQTRRMLLLWSNDGTDREMDQHPTAAYYAGSANKQKITFVHELHRMIV